MELDVHLTKEGEETWGFRLIGGKDFAMPLTVVKVIPGSPASIAGLRNGDSVCHINDRDSSLMSHDDAKKFVADADDLKLGVKRGLYDPVLDDYDPIYEPIDQEDFDQPSQPTEVDPFKIQQFLDPTQTPVGQYFDPRHTPGGQYSDPRHSLTPGLPELRDIETPRLNGTSGLGLESRSLTASPFVLPTKPYRPFSTEPLPNTEVPPVEDPIILNPNYKDAFGKHGDPINGGDAEFFPETRFKLPISEQYDPDGTKRKKKEGSVFKEVKFVEEETTKTRKDISVTEVKYSSEMKQKAVEERQFMEKMKKEIDLDKIEKTAVSVVDESIERAVSVTDEIKKEIDVALQESSITSSKAEESKSILKTAKISTSETVKETKAKSELISENNRKEATELVELIDKTTEEIITENGHKAEVSVAKEVRKFESQVTKEQFVDERKLSTKQEIEETIEVGSVRRKSEVFDKKEVKSLESERVEKKTVQAKDVKKLDEGVQVASDVKQLRESQLKVTTESDVQKNDVKTESASYAAQKISEVRKESVSSQKSGVKSSTATKGRVQSDHNKAYLIGLQTIPNIKGTIHAFHYHLLLKTFFIHLTDVMVALSRFILTQPAFSEESQDVVTEQSVTEYKEKFVKDDKVIDQKHEVVERKRSTVTEVKDFEVKKEEKAEMVEKKQEIKTEEKVKALVETAVDRKEEISTSKALVTERVIDHQEDTKKAIAQEVVVEAIEDRRYRDDVQDNYEVEQIMDRKEKLSGAQMAQVQERKSAELTQRMDAVITEFQNKAGIEELEITRERRSRSRSKVDDEVALSSQHITETTTESKLYSSTMESRDRKRVEKHEKREKTSKSEAGKQMYVAIVESHVFTNKDAIFADQVVDFSETSSVVSADEINIAMQASETVATEKVSLESKEMKQEVAETVLEESRELNVVNAQTEVVQMAEEVKSTAIVEETEAIVEEVKEEKAVDVKADVVQEVVIQEVIEPIVEVHEIKSVEISEDYQKVELKEEEHIMTVSEQTEVSIAETHETIAIEEVKKEEYAAVSIEESKAVEIVQEEIKEIVKEEAKLEEVQSIEVKEEIEAVEVVHEEIKAIEVKEEIKAVEVVQEVIKVEEVVKEEIKQEKKATELVKQEIKIVEYVPPPIQEVSVEMKVFTRSRTPVYQEESAALTIVKPARTPTDEKPEMIFTEQSDLSIKKETEILGSDSQYAEIHRSKLEMESTQIQEATFVAKSADTTTLSRSQQRPLTLDLQARRESESSVGSFPSTISTPTPGTVPPTPVTDNYMFKLKAKAPKEDGTPIPRDCTPTPEDEDPHIVKKKLLPYIDTTLESPIIYDPPLPSPPLDKPQSPVYTKPGLKGGCDRLYFRKEEILEIERKSTLLASAIDETIKSIEEYKEEVGIDTKKEVKVEESSKFEKTGSESFEEHTVSKSEIITKSSTEAQPIIYNGFAKVETKVYNTIESSKFDEEWNNIERQVKESSEELSDLSNNIDVEVNVTLTVDDVQSEIKGHEIQQSVEGKIASTDVTESKSAISDTGGSGKEISATFIITSETRPSTKEAVESQPRKDSMKEITEMVKPQEIEVRTEKSTKTETVEHTKKVSVNISEQSTKMTNGDVSDISQNSIMNGGLAIPEESAIDKDQKAIPNGDVSNVSQKYVSNGDIPTVAQIPKVKEAVTNGRMTEELQNGDINKTNSENGEITEVTPKSEVDIPKAIIEKPPPMFVMEEKKDPMAGYRPIQFDPEEIKATRRGLQSIHLSVQNQSYQRAQSPSYVDSKGILLGTQQGIVDGLEEAVVDEEVAKELGKPGMTEQKIAELISGESEMLREAHVMGLSRVLKSHMHRPDDDSSVDFKKIKPILESLKDSEVLKVLNEEIEKAREAKRKEEEKKWTTFLQKPKRPVPKVKFGYPGWVQEEEQIEEPYKVKIVKQPKPKVAPDYKPKNFETGPLPWEERALNEPPAPPVEAEEPILIPEELPEFLEAVDPLPESEVPDLEDTGIPLPPPTPIEETTPSPIPGDQEQIEVEAEPEELEVEEVVEETAEIVEEMEQNRLAEQLLMGVQSMVDPNASVEQQLAQMRAQVAALAQLPCVIQQTLDVVTRQLSQLSQSEVTSQVTTVAKTRSHSEMRMESEECTEVKQNSCEAIEEEPPSPQGETQDALTNDEDDRPTIAEVVETKPTLTQEEIEKLKREEEEMLEEQRRVEKQKKELMDQMRLDQESRQVKQRPTPRVGKPKPVFGPPTPVARPLVLPGGRKWRKPEDAYNEAFIKETLTSQAELIQGKTMGSHSHLFVRLMCCLFVCMLRWQIEVWNDIWPWGNDKSYCRQYRINFMKYEKPPVSLDHLQHSETYKLIHNMETEPPKRVELRTPVIAEADYREKCRSVTPSTMMNPQQLYP